MIKFRVCGTKFHDICTMYIYVSVFRPCLVEVGAGVGRRMRSLAEIEGAEVKCPC